MKKNLADRIDLNPFQLINQWMEEILNMIRFPGTGLLQAEVLQFVFIDCFSDHFQLGSEVHHLHHKNITEIKSTMSELVFS